jgi:hypothetical protein
MILRVIWQKPFEFENLGGCYKLGQWRPATGRYGRRSTAVAVQALLACPELSPWPPRRREPSSIVTVVVALYITRARRGVEFLFLFCHRRCSAPPLTAAAIQPYPAKTTTPSSSPRSRTSPSPPALAFFHPNRPHHRFLLQLR